MYLRHKTLNPNQKTQLLLDILEIIGDDIDTDKLVQAKERELAKYGFEINAEKEAQRVRLIKKMGEL